MLSLKTTPLKKQFFILLFLLASVCGRSQTVIVSKLLDSVSKKPIPFANIGIPRKGLGSVSDENGNFQLTIPDSLLKFPLKISCLGYNTKIFYANKFTPNTIYMGPSSLSLNEVTVFEKKKLTKTTIGNTRARPSIELAYKAEDLGYEMGVKVNVKHSRTRLKKLKFSIGTGSFDSILFRFNVYEVDQFGFPGENILKQTILVHVPAKSRRVEVDLSEYNIVVNDDFFLALEWIKKTGEMKTKTDYLSFDSEMMSGGTYYRKTSQDKWSLLFDYGVGAGLCVDVEY